MTKILVVEDDSLLGEMLTLYLSEEQFDVRRVETAKDGYDALRRFSPDAIVLDLILPDAEGTDVCRFFREKSSVPIIVTSMKSAVADRIRAIMCGADDYLTKPYSVQELKVRIMAVLRRIAAYSPSSHPEAPARCRIGLDQERRTIVMDGEPIETTFSEYELMKLFTKHPGRVFSREDLLNAVRGADSYVSERAMDVHIANLRRKLEPDVKQPRHIKTVWGIGYKFMN